MAKSTSNANASNRAIQLSALHTGLIAALGITLLCLGLSRPIEPIEIEALNQLAPALSDLAFMSKEEAVAFSEDVVSQVISLATLFAISFLPIWWVFIRRKRFTSKVVYFAYYVLVAMVEFFLLKTLHVMPLLCTSAVAIALSGLSAEILKDHSDRKKQVDSKNYELILRNRDLEDARRALIKQDEVERRLLAADLHDQVLNDLKKILEMFSKFENEPKKETSSQIRSSFQKTMNDIREIMDDLCPVMLQNFGFRAAVEDCLDKARERSGFETDLQCNVDDSMFDSLLAHEQALLFRLVQESLTNVSKHAKASNVIVAMESNSKNLIITVEDDGTGIDYENLSHQSRGLRYMKLRADLINTTVEWKAGKGGKGTRVIISYVFPVITIKAVDSSKS
ncbi:MAG: hypothetical protein K2X93_21745 [Candidatus Obscuribacterales bacterium]|nr:hypothetical protein [Candidatus Obscuribacterales bacterium]